MSYKPSFLEKKIALPDYSKHAKEVSTRKGTKSALLDYTNFSLVHHAGRQLPLFTAVNIVGKHYKPVTRDADKWQVDSRLDPPNQLDNTFYKNTGKTFSRGHLVRRLDPAWGRKSLMAQEQTFHFTNCCPQHQRFNAGIWLELERHVLEKGAVAGKKKISVFSGPVLNPRDPFFYKPVGGKDVKIPLLFWKVIVYQTSDNHFSAVGFLQSQFPWVSTRIRSSKKVTRFADRYFQDLKFKDGNTYQVKIETIEKYTGLKFKWKGVKFPYDKKEAMVLQKIQPPKAYRGGKAATRSAAGARKAEINMVL